MTAAGRPGTACLEAPGGAGPNLTVTTFLTYASVPAVVFGQTAASTIATGGTKADQGRVGTSFPAFVVPTTAGDVGAMQYHGAFINDGSNGPILGPWCTATKFATGLDSGPLVLFTRDLTATLVFSSAAQHMAGTVDLAGGALRAGVIGSFDPIPAGFTYATVLWAGAGPNAAVAAWGAGLLLRTGKVAWQGEDFTNTHLIYNTE